MLWEILAPALLPAKKSLPHGRSHSATAPGKAVGVGNHPLDGGPAILVCDREWMLRPSSVFDGDGDGNEGVQVVVICRRRGGFDAESSAMEVD